MQIWYNNTDHSWADKLPHMHTESDECFIVLHGTLVIEVEGEKLTIGPREFCCFPRGLYHAIVDVHTPAEMLMIRAPLVKDKVYKNLEGS